MSTELEKPRHPLETQSLIKTAADISILVDKTAADISILIGTIAADIY